MGWELRRTLRTTASIGAAFVGGMVVASSAEALRGEDGAYAKLGVFARALHYIESSYVDEIETDQLVYGAIRGMVATLDERSAFLDPQELAALKARAGERFGGVGVLLAREEDAVVVAAMTQGAPAARAGLLLGDRLLEIDGQSTTALTVEEAAERLRGEPGTRIRMKVWRSRRRSVDALELSRVPVAEPTVIARWLSPATGYLKIRTFADTTYDEVKDALARFRSERKLGRMVLDVRGNSGGLLEQAVRVSDLWIADGIIVSTAGRHQGREEQRAHPRGTEPDYPMVVLIDDKSASASEVLAGALQDTERARLMGTTSFGKGSVQTIIELEDGSALRLTVARYRTPKGRSLQGKGLSPDLPLPLSAVSSPGRDLALVAAMAHLEGRDYRRAIEGIPARPAGSFTEKKAHGIHNY